MAQVRMGLGLTAAVVFNPVPGGAPDRWFSFQPTDAAAIPMTHSAIQCI